MTYRLLPLAPQAAPVEPTDLTFIMAPAIRGAIADGPMVSQPGTVVPPIQAGLYRRSDLNDLVVAFDQSFTRRWQDELNEPGSASCQLLNDDPDLAFLEHSDVIRFTINGYAAFTWLVREIEQLTIAQGEEHDQVTTLSGPGHVAIFDEALVYPSRGVGVLPIEEDRPFNWTSTDYDDSGWTTARASMSVDTAVTTWPLRPFGDGFPSGTSAQVIWDLPAAGTARPPGDCYFRKEYTSTGGALIYAVIDDGGEIYFDGQLILSCLTGFATVYTMSLQVTPGEHTIAVHGQNGPGAPDSVFDNPAGIAIAVWPCDANGQPVGSSPDVVTDSSWKIVAYPPGPPGMTPGEVVIHCVNEALARGCLPPVTFNFDKETDSAGNPWPEVTDITTKVGTDVLTFFFKELASTYVDLWLEPASWTLWAWVRDQRGWERLITLHAPTDPNDPWSGNLGALTHKVVT